jgi:hypothetical protein
MIFSHPLFPEATEFDDRELKERARQFLADMKVLFPALARISNCHVEHHYEIKEGRMTLFIDLVLPPQGRLKFSTSSRKSGSDQGVLEETAKMIFESSEVTQDAIYAIAHQANLGESPFVNQSALSQEEIALHARMKRYRNQEVWVETGNGQIRFNFPDFNDVQMAESSVEISGIVELVGADRIKLLAIRSEGQHLEAIRLPSTGQSKWIYLAPSKNVQSIAMDAWMACCNRQRIALFVRPVINTLNRKVAYFILND